MDNNRIQDIHSLKEAAQNIQNIKSLRRLYPILKLPLKLLKANTTDIKNSLDKALEQAKALEELITIPDRFNDLFASKGWIAYGMLNAEVMQVAVTKAEAGDVDGAEADLVEYYSPETVKWNLSMMWGIKAFRIRMPLAQKALIDYQERRYYSSILVVLTLLDGFVNDLDKVRGFFAAGTDLEAWDSIAAHIKGLTRLKNVLYEPRLTTIDDPITIPYRNGILHGRDLGYDNKIVAAKCWAALFAVAEWGRKIEQDLRTAPPEKPKTTWRTIAQLILDNADEKKRLAAWSPRSIEVGKDVPVSGEPKEFSQGTPEEKLADFFLGWRTGNYGKMVQCLPLISKPHKGKAAWQLKSHYSSKSLKIFELIEIKDEAPAVTIITAKIIYEWNATDMETIIEFRLLNEDANGNPTVRGKPSSSWVITPYLV